MVEKVRSLFAGGEWTVKKVMVSLLFLAIVVVMIGFGIRPDSGGDALGGVAAVVNDVPIPLAEFRAESEQRERDLQARFNDLPEAQRRLYTNGLRRQIMDRLITSEIIYQASTKRGVLAADGELREQLLAIPSFNENGRFQRERYKSYLMSAGLSPADFERQLRKQIVTQKVYDLFLGAAEPAREELKRNRELANHKANVRYVELSKDVLQRLVSISDADVSNYLSTHQAEVDGYYRDNKIEFTRPTKFKARDLLVRITDQRPDAEALKRAQNLQFQASVKNFADLAKANSDDPGLKTRGGDLGEREQGSLPPEFEDAVLKLKPGQVSAPIKAEGGYHVVLLEKLTPGGTTPPEAARPEIARKLLAAGKHDEQLAQVKSLLGAGNVKAVEQLVVKAGAKWETTGEFDLSTAQIPKLGESRELLNAVVEVGAKGGLVPRVVPGTPGTSLIVDVTSVKTVADSGADVAGIDRMVAYRRAEGPITAWIKDVERTSSIQRNARLLQ